MNIILQYSLRWC